MKKLLTAALVLLAAAVMGACAASSANLTDIRMCDNADSEGACISDKSTFRTDTDEIFLSAQLENAPGDTKVTATWKYLGGEEGVDPQEIDSVTVTTEEAGTLPFYSSMPAGDSGWPKGDYEVILTLGTDNSEPVSRKFSVRQSQSGY